MRYTAAATYPFTADYYSTVNTNPDPLAPPTWEDTFVRAVKLQISADPQRTNLIWVYTQEVMALGYLLKNFKDVKGNALFPVAANNLGIDYTAYVIKSIDPVINPFGYSEAIRYQCVPLNNLRRG